MKLVEITDEFERQEFSTKKEKLNQLFRIQKLRAYEFASYFFHLANKYPSLEMSQIWDIGSGLPVEHVSSNPNMLNLASQLSRRCVLKVLSKIYEIPENDKPFIPQQEKTKYQEKLDRFIQAKKAYQRAGGKYNERT